MTASFVPLNSSAQRRVASQIWWIVYAIVLGGGLFLASFAGTRISEPFLGATLGLLLLLLVGWLIRPRVTLYMTLMLTAIADQVTVAWFPFVKNLSSRESISFVADAATVSPLDLALATGAVVSALRQYADTGRPVAPSPLLRPVVAFTALTALGFARGISAHGDLRIAVFEARPLFYILMVFVIVSNECTKDVHRRRALYAVVVGVTIQSLLAIEYMGRLTANERDALESLTEHGSALGQCVVIIMLAGLAVFRVRRPLLRWGLLASLVPVVFVFFVAQRRAGVAALVVGAALMSIALLWRQRRTFWLVTPAVCVLLAGYTAAFWSSTSDVGFPAQAIKTVIAPGSASEADYQSDMYRVVESFDLNFTIRTEPILGLGFGRPFYRPIPLPTITDFDLSLYKPHNSILWIWIKMGFAGFVAMFYLIGKAILHGTQRLRSEPIGVDYIVTMTGVLFVVMYAVYTYVDISWDARNTVLLGYALAVCVGRPTAGSASRSSDSRRLHATHPQRRFGDSDRTTSATPVA